MAEKKQIVGFPEVDYARDFRRGVDLVQYGDDDPIAWPRCEITGCPNGICVGMSESLCYPHGIEFRAFTEAAFEADRKKRHRH